MTQNRPAAGHAPLPDGEVTFLFSDVQGSTRLWEEHPELMRAALARHDQIFDTLTEHHHGCVVKPRGEGDSRFCVFAKAADGVAAAAAIQLALQTEPWPTPGPIIVRLALHTGEAELREGDYYGRAVNRCARLRAVAHGTQTLLSGSTYDQVRENLLPGCKTEDLGEHRLKDLSTPERIYQLIVPGMPRDFPPLLTLNSRPNNLPVQLTSFVGRENETAEVMRLLASPIGGKVAGVRLLTLTGPGGSGKTRLALQVAAELVERFPDGVWLVELAGLSDPSLVAQTTASAIGLRDESGRPPLDLLTRHLAQKQTLLLLDNCEHLVAACAEVAVALLRTCPRLQMLATSREGLRLAGETTWPVPSLSVPSPSSAQSGEVNLAALGQYESIKLFVERAGAVTRAFELTAQNASAIAQLCHRLDGIPLAIELAAARTRLLPVEQILARVQDRFRLLTGGSRTALPRQQTLRALVDWSYDLLSMPERKLFNRLSVFAGGWILEAAEIVCADDSGAGAGNVLRSEEVLDLLGTLLEKSMVVAERVADGTARYRLLETMRHYGLERMLAEGEDALDKLHWRHAEYFVALGDQVAAGMHGPDQVKWWGRLELEQDNLRAVLEWGKAAGAPADRVELVLRLAGSLYLPWFRRGHGREERQHFEALLAHPNAARPTRARAQALFAVGSLSLWQDGDDALAWKTLNESLALAEVLGDTHCMANARHNLGVVLQNRGDIAGARQHHETALRLTQADGDPVGIRWSLEDLADVAAEEGNIKRSLEIYEEALSFARQTGDLHAIGSILQSKGALARGAGNVESARALIGEGLGIMHQIGCWHCCARYLGDLAFVMGASGEPERAVRLLGAAESLRERTGIIIRPKASAVIEKALSDARQRIGELAYADALSQGRALLLPAAIEHALATSATRIHS